MKHLFRTLFPAAVLILFQGCASTAPSHAVAKYAGDSPDEMVYVYPMHEGGLWSLDSASRIQRKGHNVLLISVDGRSPYPTSDEVAKAMPYYIGRTWGLGGHNVFTHIEKTERENFPDYCEVAPGRHELIIRLENYDGTKREWLTPARALILETEPGVWYDFRAEWEEIPPGQADEPSNARITEFGVYAVRNGIETQIAGLADTVPIRE